jgi:leucyl aminopeptidase
MQFSIKTSAVGTLKTGCVIVPVTGRGTLGAMGSAVDTALDGELTATLAHGDLPAKVGATLLVYGDRKRIARVLLVSMGADGPVTEKRFADATRSALRQLRALGAEEAVSLLHEIDTVGRPLGWRLRRQVAIGREIAYRFEHLKSKKEDPASGGGKVAFLLTRGEAAAAQRDVERAVALANGMDLAKDLGNLPSNICTPTYMAGEARKLARQFKLKVEVLERKQMEALRMGSLLAVAQGSDEAPKLILLQYRGGPESEAPVALVGKGITFDTGGISLKPGAGMEDMKYDMCGAASVMGTIRAVAEMQLPINVVGVIPAVENMPSGKAIKPGDIVTSMSGQTIEILNTDAEGRLILCDALTYTERFKPAAVVDIATLTGACVIALGEHNSGLFSTNDALAGELLAAGRESGDRCWRLPIEDEYDEQLKSAFADMANIGGRGAGSVTAACFLARYTKAYPWAHLDIAGTAWKTSGGKGSSARPVPLLTSFLEARAD